MNDGTLEQLLDYDALGNRVRQTLTQPGQPTLTTDYRLDVRTDLSQILSETTTGGPTTRGTCSAWTPSASSRTARGVTSATTASVRCAT